MIEAAPVDAIADASRAMMGRPDSTADLGAVRCPALVIVGAEDVITPPADAAALQHAIAGARMVVLPAAGHLSSLEVPDAFSAAMSEFLRSDVM
jgi:pimeloyl-ACP methyl ester carboxylesterase